MTTKKKGTGLLMVWVDVPADIEKEFSSDGRARAGCRCRPAGPGSAVTAEPAVLLTRPGSGPMLRIPERQPRGTSPTGRKICRTDRC